MKKTRRTRFITWARRDMNDTTPIKYTFKESTGKELKMTSENTVSYHLMERIRYAWIDSIEKKQDESGEYWDVRIYED